MKLLNLRDARALGCDMTPQMAQAVEAWDRLFYLTDQPPHSLKMAQSLTGYMATLATSETTFSTGTGARANASPYPTAHTGTAAITSTAECCLRNTVERLISTASTVKAIRPGQLDRPLACQAVNITAAAPITWMEGQTLVLVSKV